MYITDKAYTERDIIRMELKILEGIQFNLGRPLSIHFLRRASKAGGVEAITHTLAKYIMELRYVKKRIVGPQGGLLDCCFATIINNLIKTNFFVENNRAFNLEFVNKAPSENYSTKAPC